MTSELLQFSDPKFHSASGHRHIYCKTLVVDVVRDGQQRCVVLKLNIPLSLADFHFTSEPLHIQSIGLEVDLDLFFVKIIKFTCEHVHIYPEDAWKWNTKISKGSTYKLV